MNKQNKIYANTEKPPQNEIVETISTWNRIFFVHYLFSFFTAFNDNYIFFSRINNDFAVWIHFISFFISTIYHIFKTKERHQWQHQSPLPSNLHIATLNGQNLDVTMKFNGNGNRDAIQIVLVLGFFFHFYFYAKWIYFWYECLNC